MHNNICILSSAAIIGELTGFKLRKGKAASLTGKAMVV